MDQAPGEKMLCVQFGKKKARFYFFVAWACLEGEAMIQIQAFLLFSSYTD